MKYGLIWFLYLDIPIQIARILVIPCFAIGFVSTIGSVLFIVSWVLFAVSLLITLCTCFMHIPSTTKVEKFISQYEKERNEMFLAIGVTIILEVIAVILLDRLACKKLYAEIRKLKQDIARREEKIRKKQEGCQ